ncbi:MAG: M15 family peptidase [Planctomycetota bacterium]
MTRAEKQRLHTKLFASLILWANGWGRPRGIYAVMFELQRSPEAARWNSLHCRVCQKHKDLKVHALPKSQGGHRFRAIGIATSLHCIRLAGDLGLFQVRPGHTPLYLTQSKDYTPLGEHWEDMHPLCCWGGRFKNPDGGHFSVTHRGRK